MAAGAFTLYSNAILEISKGQINLSADTFAFVLATNSYVPAPNTDGLWNAVSGYQLPTGSGYTAGGVTLASVTDMLAGGTVTFSAGSPIWTSFTAGPFRYGVICRRAGSTLASTDLLLCYSDLTGGGTVTGSGGSYAITIPSAGIFQMIHQP